MIVIEARNVNDALEKGIAVLKMEGREEDSRNGPVIVARTPVMTVYEKPWERVLFSAARDANPFFHLYEALWMLAGRNDVASVANYAARMKDFSDDGEHLHGAYGFRWREWFSFDQLGELIAHLNDQPNSRRAVLAMWSPSGDLVASEGVGGIGSKDVPCNTHIYFRRRGAKLDMTVLCRSNDMVWGAYGANAVHFSVLHEIVAAATGMPQGRMYQFSNDFHIYKNLPQFEALWNSGNATLTGHGDPTGTVRAHGPRSWQWKNPYETRGSLEKTIPLVAKGETTDQFFQDCDHLMSESRGDVMLYQTSFMRHLVFPVLASHAVWRAAGPWREEMDCAPACDWKLAANEWLERREKKA